MFLKRFIKDHAILTLSTLSVFRRIILSRIVLFWQIANAKRYGQAFGKMLFRIIMTAAVSSTFRIIAKNATTKQIIRKRPPDFYYYNLISFL